MEQNACYSQEEKEIRNKAKKRVRFKIHIVIYLFTCLLLWLFWYFIFKGSRYEDLTAAALKVCLFVTSTWGICIIAHYLIVYKWNKTLVEKEIKQLKKEQERKQKENEELQQIDNN